MSGHEDEYHHAMFDMANDGVDHSDYKQTDDFEQTPLHFDSTNNFQDNFGTTSFDSEKHSQVKKPTSGLNSKAINESHQPKSSILQQAFQQAGFGPNEFINALLNDSLPDSLPQNDRDDTLKALIEAEIYTDRYGSTVDFDSNKGSKWKNFDDEDNLDIHGGDTSNACDDDNLGINSPGSSQIFSQSSGLYDKPCSSTSSPAASTSAHTLVVQPTSPPTHLDGEIVPSPTSKDFKNLEVYNRPDDRGINHEELEYDMGPEYSAPQILPRTTYASGIAVGPVPTQIILPSPIAASPLPQTTTVPDPMNANNHYSVDKMQLSLFLKENGRQVSGRKRKSKEEIERLIKRFCDPKELDYCTANDAQDIIDSDVEVKNVPLRNRSDKGRYLCKFCPITQKHERGFDRKEDMKRHYHQHLNYVRFSCKHCEYKNARTDHMKNHMKKCHPEKDSMDYNRNS